MKFKMKNNILPFIFSAVLMSCQNGDREGQEVEILSQDQKTETVKPVDTLNRETGVDSLNRETGMEKNTAFQRFGDDPELSNFNRSVMSSGISEEFEGKEGPFTFFAPSNTAYDQLPADQKDRISDVRNKSENKELMKYYMVDGEMTVNWISEKINSSNNKSYPIKTMNGKELTATMEGNKVILTDASGNRAVVQKSELDDRFGVYHTIDNVLWPEGISERQVQTN